jgi:hypothetical protein
MMNEADRYSFLAYSTTAIIRKMQANTSRRMP